MQHNDLRYFLVRVSWILTCFLFGILFQVAASCGIFFGDLVWDLVGKPIDVLATENSALFSGVTVKIAALTGRSYVVVVSVSRYSFRS